MRAAVPGATVEGLENAAAAAAAPVVVMSVPFAGAAATYKAIAESLKPGTLVIDATVPLAPAVGGKPTRMVGVWQGSAAQQAAEIVPDGVDVVSALHTVSASSLADLGPRARRGRARLRRPQATQARRDRPDRADRRAARRSTPAGSSTRGSPSR